MPAGFKVFTELVYDAQANGPSHLGTVLSAVFQRADPERLVSPPPQVCFARRAPIEIVPQRDAEDVAGDPDGQRDVHKFSVVPLSSFGRVLVVHGNKDLVE